VFRHLHHAHGHHITSAGHLILLFVGARIGTRSGWLFSLSVIAGISLVLWTLNFRRSRAIGDTPTSRIASAPQGYVELHGVGRMHEGQALNAPLTGEPCLWYRYRIEEKRGKDWRSVEHGTSDATFLLDDSSGVAVVDPESAEITTSRRRHWTQGRRRYTEWLLTPGDEIYAIGQFATVGGANSRLDHAGDVSALLAMWKANQPALKARFDLDGDGTIDLKEWELARRAAVREVRRRHDEIRSTAGHHVLARPADGRVFLLSNLDPDKLARRYALWTGMQLCIALTAGGTALWLMASMALL